MQSVEQGAIDEIGGPDHGGGPDQEAAGETGEPVAGAQRGDAEEDLEGRPKVLAVKDLLRNQDVRGVDDAAAVGSLEQCERAATKRGARRSRLTWQQ